MKKINIIKAVCFALIFGVLFIYLTRVFIPESFNDAKWPTTAAFHGLYDMDKDSIDVLFVGSSACKAAYNTQELYNNYGITSYNLGSEHQSIFVSYYWIKEALKNQKPKAVVLECRTLFDAGSDNELNMPEPYLRKALDDMKWSDNKKEAVDTICMLDESQSKLSYYFPIIRYHSRWDEISESDFLKHYLSGIKKNDAKGSVSIKYHVGASGYEPYYCSDDVEKMDVPAVMQEYLDRILNLCKENEIELILTTTPTAVATAQKNRTIREYAYANGVKYIDFNDKNTYDEIGYDYNSDNGDNSHANVWGAMKMTNYIGNELVKGNIVIPKLDEQWEISKKAYDNILTDIGFMNLDSMDEYLYQLISNKDRYSILITFKEEGTPYLTDNQVEMMKQLGLEADLKDSFRNSYYAVCSGGEVIEKQSVEAIEEDGVLEMSVPYKIMSAALGVGYDCSIEIDGQKYGNDISGMHIVVYNNENKEVLDAITFNTCTSEQVASR